MNDAYTSGINCPYEIPDQWKYLFIADWYVDPTLRFTCTKTRQQWEEEQRQQRAAEGCITRTGDVFLLVLSFFEGFSL